MKGVLWSFLLYLMQVLMHSTQTPPHKCMLRYQEVYFMALFFHLSVGCVLHSSVPLPGSGRSLGPRSHSTWSYRWDCLLP